MNGNSSVGGSGQPPKIVEMVYSLLEMLRLSSAEEMSDKLLLMSHSPQICQEMRQYGCLPLLIQLIHQQMDRPMIAATDTDKDAREKRLAADRKLRDSASKTLRNIVYNSAKNRREIRVFKLIDDLRSFVNYLRLNCTTCDDHHTDHPSTSIAYLLKVSFDEQHRQFITMLGGVYAIAEVIQYDYEYHRNARNNGCITLRRYSLMTLINLTFGDSQTKSLLATMVSFMRALVHNLESPAEELRQVAASLLRNLSWKADYITKQILREVGTVALLTQAALEATKESTLKSILLALLNLTAHCGPNKADLCKVDGALSFLISTLTYTSTSGSISIIENGGGILRNVSSYIVMNEDMREILRKHNTLAILLEQLKSASIAVVSNACVTLWNLSAHSSADQTTLWELGAVPMLRNLTSSRHKLIAMGASATLRNLLSSTVANKYISLSGLNGNNSCSIPSLQARKLKALKDELNCNLSETYDPMDSPRVSPSHEPYMRCKSSTTPKSNVYLPGRMYTSFSGHINPHQVSRSNSHDSIGSTHSEPVAKFKDIEHNLRSIYPFSTQQMPQMYANDSQISDKDLDMSSDFDVYCGESNSQMNISSASAKSSSFNDPEVDVDPEPTDYSKRYKERPIDDFVAPRSVKPEVAGCEDSVKVYKTEGTPLNFSLASSLSDLRDCTGLMSIGEEKSRSMAATNETFQETNVAKSIHGSKSPLKVTFKKPTLPPKPKFATLPKRKPPTVGVELIGEPIGSEPKKLEPKSAASFDESFMKTSLSTNSIVSIDVSNENLCEETPLMYSRSSSLDSLNDCDIQSDVCQSSVVSEFSRRESQVVSPSEIPDSPLDSPRPLSPKLSASTPNSSQTALKHDNNILQNNCMPNAIINQSLDNTTVAESTIFFEDRPVKYATEDTPAIFSLATSLSSLTEDMNDMDINDDSKPNDSQNDYKLNVEVIDVTDIETEIVCTSSDDEGEEALLAACISSGMKNITNEKIISGNSLPRINSKEVVVSSSPTKPIPIPQQRRRVGPPNRPLPALPFLVRSAPDGKDSYLEKDTVKVYGTEGTPVVLSKTSSISELSFSTNGKSGNVSTNRCEVLDESDDEEILQKCIESGMTANRKHPMNDTKKFVIKSNNDKRSPKTPKTTPNASPNNGNVGHNKTEEQQKTDANGDQTKRFFVEDTPVQLSHCQSLSSLSIDDSDDYMDTKTLNEMIARGMNQSKSPSKSSAKSPSKSRLHTKKLIDNVMTKSNNSTDNSEFDTNTYTVCPKNERLVKCEPIRKLTDSLMTSSVMTDSSCLSDLDHQKPPSLMDNSMFSSTESFSYHKFPPKPTVTNKRSDESQILLDNVKPPSIMEDMSMTQSCASITSDIPELAFDGDVKCDTKISEMAKMCANGINSMTYLADSSDAGSTERISRKNKTIINSMSPSTQQEYDISDTEVSQDLSADGQRLNTSASHNDIISDFTTSSSTLLSLESPTLCTDVISDFEDKTRLMRRDKELILSKRRFSPIGSEDVVVIDDHSVLSDESDPDSPATYNVQSPRKARIVRPVARKSPKDDFQVMSQTVMPINSSFLSKNKYTAKQTRTSALRASRSRSVDTHLSEDLAVQSAQQHKGSDRQLFTTNRHKYIDYMPDTNPDIHYNDYNNGFKPPKQHKDSSAGKSKDKWLLSNVRSKLSGSLSSHTLGASNASLSSSSSNGVTPSCASFSRRLEVQSRIASLWKRSKSTGNEKSSESKSKKLDLSRSISQRRSFGKSSKSVDKNTCPLARSSTYEKLPQTADEASTLDSCAVTSTDSQQKQTSDKFNNNYIDRHDTTATTAHHKRQQSADKTNGNTGSYVSAKHSSSAKSSNKYKTKNLFLNNNAVNDSSARHPMPQQNMTTSATTGKPSANSRRTCLVTAV